MSLLRKTKPSRRLQALTGKSQGSEDTMSHEQTARRDMVVTETHERFNGRNGNVLASLAEILMGDANDQNYKVVTDFYTLEEV